MAKTETILSPSAISTFGKPFRAIEGDDSMDAIFSGVEAQFQTAANYSLFSGTTTNGYEGGWYGFKHTSSKWCTAIAFIRERSYIIKRNPSGGVWTAYYLV